MPIKTKYVCSITVTDPDTLGPVEVEIRKLETGGMVGIDGSWLESDEGPTYSPYDLGIVLNIPDDETDSNTPTFDCTNRTPGSCAICEGGHDTASCPQRFQFKT